MVYLDRMEILVIQMFHSRTEAVQLIYGVLIILALLLLQMKIGLSMLRLDI